MLISLDWLNDYVSLDGLQAADIAEALTNSGLEVEAIEVKGGVFSGVVVGYVQAVDPHPNADRLRLVTVDLGDKGQNQVVCGAPNVAQGMRIAYAQIGAQVINRKEGGLFELTPAKIRGVDSTGMCCSLDELGLVEQYGPAGEGIWDLSTLTTDSQRGQDLKAALQLSSYAVLDVAPTANRGDLMSMWGVAREVAALFNRPLKIQEPPKPQYNASSDVVIEVKDPTICEFYGGATLTNVSIEPSPAWLVQRLEDAGVRAINNVVDITNYVMLETGQPLHAFDLEKVRQLSAGKTPTIGVRRAQSGESLTTLDEVERPLTDQSVLITLNDTPVALAGVMGGLSTEMDETSKTVFLECAYFPSASTRRSARSVGLRSESSARFERGIDKMGCDRAMARAIELIEQLAGARLDSMVGQDLRQSSPLTIILTISTMNRILGLEIPVADVTSILTHLGFEVKPGAEKFEVTVPSYRQHDVSREIDLIEEIIRVYGYDRIPYSLPSKVAAPEMSPRQAFLEVVRRTMVAQGLTEVSTASLIGPTLLEETQSQLEESKAVRLTNSHSAEHVVMRQELLPSLLDITVLNESRGNQDLWLFELGRVYHRTYTPSEKQTGVKETLKLAGIMKGQPDATPWRPGLTVDFFTLKGVLEQLLERCRISQSPRWVAEATSSMMHPGQTATVKVGKQVLGFVGQLHPRMVEHLKLKGSVYAFEWDIDALFELFQKQAPLKAKPLSSYQAVERDISFRVPSTVSHQQIVGAIQKANQPLIQTIELFDEYKAAPEGGSGEPIRSLAYRLTLQSDAETLTEATINAVMTAVTDALNAELNITLRV